MEMEPVMWVSCGYDYDGEGDEMRGALILGLISFGFAPYIFLFD
jgi:hypothetical protein